LTAIYRRGAAFVDKILKGTKPADLPVEQPTVYELVVNVKTLQAFGAGNSAFSAAASHGVDPVRRRTLLTRVAVLAGAPLGPLFVDGCQALPFASFDLHFAQNGLVEGENLTYPGLESATAHLLTNSCG
jgi:hypothetical protein